MNPNKIDLKNLPFQQLVETGNNYIREQNLKFAEKYYDEALKKINSSTSKDSFYLNYANCKLQLAKYDEAKKFYEHSLSLNSNLYPAYQSLALCEITLFNQKKNLDPLRAFNSTYIKNALEIIKQAIKLNPDDIENYKYLGLLFSEIDDLENTVTNFKKYLFVKFDFSLIKKYCSILAEYGLYDDIFELCNFWLQSNILNVDQKAYLRRRIAIFFLVSNDFKQAESSLKECLSSREYFPNTILDLNSIRKFNVNDDVVKQVEIGLKKDFFNDIEIPVLYQFLADVYERVDDNAFINYLSLSKKARFKIRRNSFKINDSILIDNGKLLDGIESNEVKDFRPIFIVGMPRSGTTLAHQVISNHSLVHGLGEFPDLPSSLRNFSDKISSKINLLDLQDFINKVAQKYVLNAKFINCNKKIFVDKSPLNFLYLNHIVKLFPNAKIISCERDPMDICWSIYRNYFTTDFVYFYQLKDIADTYKSYKKIMDYWKERLPEYIFSLNYEQFIDNQHEITKRLLKFCNLNYEEQCLQPEKNKSKISTVSKFEARKKVNDGNKRKWEKYKDHLKPLIDSLSNIK